MDHINLSTLLEVPEIQSVIGLVEITRNGIKKYVIEQLATSLNLPLAELTKLLPISNRTLQRYSSDSILSKELSDHVLQIAKVFVKAVDVFEDEANAVSWLKQPNIALGGLTPMDLFDTYSGIDWVIGELMKIEQGIYA